MSVRRTGRGHHRALAPLLAAALLATAACGSQLSDAERAPYLPAEGGGAATASAGTGGAAAGGTDGALAAGTDGTAAATTGGGTGGTGGATATTAAGGGGAAGGGAAPCAARSTEIGVTDSTITLGGVFQLSGPVTGFAQQFLTGVRAKVAQVNAAGGVCGRKIEYLSRDDGFDAARNASQTRDLFPKVLAIAGSFSTVDNGGATALAGTNVPDDSVAGTPERAALPNHVSHSPFPKKTGQPNPAYTFFARQGVKKAALVYVSLASARTLMDTIQASLEASGIQVVKRIELSPTQFSYDATAREIAASGAEFMYFLHELNAASAMARALSTTPNSLKVPLYSAFSYGEGFLKLAGSAAEGSVTLVPFVPFEEAAKSPPTQELIRWIQQVSPGQAPTFDAANGWTSMTLMVDALAATKGPITRASLLASLKAIDSFDAHGLWGPTSPARGTGGCTVTLQVKGGKWTRIAPAQGYFC